MKFTLISSVLFLATAAIASPEGIDVNSIVSDVEGVYSTAVGGGQSIGSDIASKATSLAEAASTAGAGALSSVKSEASSLGSAAASEASSIGSEVTSRVGTAVSTLTDAAGSATATVSTTSAGSPSGSATPSDNGAFARPTAVGVAAAGMAGVLGVMVAL